MKVKKISDFLILFPIFYFLISNFVSAATPQELKELIEQKSLELRETNNKIQEAQREIEGIQAESRTLKREISGINKQIKQLKLSIHSSELAIDKLALEIESIQYDVADAEEKIIHKRGAIAEILRELQQRDEESPLVIFLKNKTLSDGVFEIQSLVDLNNNLSVEISNLRSLKTVLASALNEKSAKKRLLEKEGVNLKNKKAIVEDVKEDKQAILKQTKNREYLYQRQLKELEKLQEEISDEIAQFEEELRLKIDPSALPTPRPGVLGWPLTLKKEGGLAVVTQKHGRTSYVLRKGRKWHNGIDIGAPLGTPIMSAEKGIVIAVGDQDNYRTNGKRLCYHGAYGKFVLIKHENNLTTLYAHLSRWIVKTGDKVERGQIIGYVGSTGRSTGPHLHFTVYSTQTIPPATPGFPEGTRSSRVCGPLPVGGDLNPLDYL